MGRYRLIDRGTKLQTGTMVALLNKSTNIDSSIDILAHP
ncbi:hypothetical protein SAMN06265347_1237 [Halobellus salinus]|nr:hypothetical protein SAMN06265347_1237 [Halobellus salinus]